MTGIFKSVNTRIFHRPVDRPLSHALAMKLLRRRLRARVDEVPVAPLNPRALEILEAIRADYQCLAEERFFSYDEIVAGSIKEEEASLLWELVVEHKPTVMLQVGTFVGVSSMLLVEAMRSVSEGKLYTIDPNVMHRGIPDVVGIAREVAARRGLEEYIEFVRGWFACPAMDYVGLDDSIETIGHQLLVSIPRLDFAFLDGNHATVSAISDFTTIKPHLSNTAIVAFHDFVCSEDVMEAMDILIRDKNLIADFTAHAQWGKDGLFVLKKKEPYRRHVAVEIQVVDSVTSDSIAGARINHEKGTLITGVDGLSPMVEVLPGEYGVRVKAEGYEGVEQYHLKVALNQSPQRIKIPLVSLTTR